MRAMRRNRMLVSVVLAAVGGLGVLTMVAVRSPGRHTAAKAAAVELAPKAIVEPHPDPKFSTPEQTARYYGAVVKGERRALEVVETALTRARAGGDATQVGQLETLRARYRDQIQRHQAHLNL